MSEGVCGGPGDGGSIYNGREEDRGLGLSRPEGPAQLRPHKSVCVCACVQEGGRGRDGMFY